jgi:hypothetical protein
MKRYFLVALVLFGAAAWPLAAQSVSYSFDKEADFSKFKTYKWVKIPNGQQLDELTADQLTATLDVELAKRALRKSSSDEADLYIGYQIASGKEKPSSNSNIWLDLWSGPGRQFRGGHRHDNRPFRTVDSGHVRQRDKKAGVARSGFPLD